MLSRIWQRGPHGTRASEYTPPPEEIRRSIASAPLNNWLAEGGEDQNQPIFEAESSVPATRSLKIIKAEQSTRGVWEYHIEVSIDDANPYIVKRRFNSFRELYDLVRPHSESLPPLPSSGFITFLRSSDPSLLKSREVKLQKILDAIETDRTLRLHKAFTKFLGKNPTTAQTGYASFSDYAPTAKAVSKKQEAAIRKKRGERRSRRSCTDLKDSSGDLRDSVGSVTAVFEESQDGIDRESLLSEFADNERESTLSLADEAVLAGRDEKVEATKDDGLSKPETTSASPEEDTIDVKTNSKSSSNSNCEEPASSFDQFQGFKREKSIMEQEQPMVAPQAA